VRDVAANYKTITHIFERVHLFLQRLNSYTGIPLTKDFMELLGKIMAQILSILALSTKTMTERRTSELVHGLCSFLADYDSEKFLKRLIGRTDVEDAVLRLDSLTKEESLMAVAKNLEVTQENLEATKKNLEVTHDVDCNVKDIKVLAEDIDDKVQAIDRVDQNVKVVKERAQLFPSLFTHVTCTDAISYRRRGSPKQERMNINVRYSSIVPLLIIQDDAHPQGIRSKRNFNDGFLLPTVPSIIIMLARLSMMGPGRGLFNAANFENGRTPVLCCGLVAIVRYSHPFCLMPH
jgi:hypothetical protein